MIQIKNISKSFGEKNVLDSVSATIKKGEITSFIGGNGAGKSTLLGIISRILEPDTGEVIIDGKNIKEYSSSELAQKISFLKQQNNIQVRLRVKELVSFGRYPYTKGRLTSKDKKIVKEAMEYMGLTHMKNRFIDTLSGGERQRAFIAMVIAQDTDYIFLDEPLNNLDMKHSVEIMQMLKKLCKEKNKTVLIVIHDINFASVYSDNILAIKDREILVNDKKDLVITREVLMDVFEMDFNICDIEGEKICVYYDSETEDCLCEERKIIDCKCKEKIREKEIMKAI